MVKQLFARTLGLFADAMEAGLYLLDWVLRALQSAVQWLCGLRIPERQNEDAYRRPTGVDAATSELANRMTRLASFAGLHPGRWLRLRREIVHSIRESCSAVRLQTMTDWLALVMELPLACATLATQEALRGLLTVRAVPVRRWPDFFSFCLETFSDLHVYFSLQYSEELVRYRALVRQEPGNGRARLELGRVYGKCGLFREAVDEITVACEHRSLHRSAFYERMVARYRLGEFHEAVSDGVAAWNAGNTDERVRFWLWLSAQKAGGYPADVPHPARIEARDGFHATVLKYESVAEEIGVDKVSGGRGTAIFDSNGNGLLDIAITGTHAGCSLFRNNGDGTFTDISQGSGLDTCLYGFAIAVGDYNNDGLPDLYISSMGFYDGAGKLLRNNGDGTFTDVTREAGIACWGPGFTATWVDYDLDGNLDLFLANNLGGLFNRKTPNRLFRNNGDGSFTDVTREAGLRTMWPTIGAAWGDIDNSMYPDLFVSGFGRAQLFRNNGDGTFSDVSRQAGIDAPAIGSVALWCDVDDDGWLDIVQTTYSRPGDAIHTLCHGHGPPNGFPLRVFRNNRDGSFSDISREADVTGCWGTMSACTADFNNDGYPDLLLGNGDPSMDRTEAAVLLQNDGYGKFRNVTFSAGLPAIGKGHGVNAADLNGDGRMHLLVANGGLYPGDLQTAAVYRPQVRPGNYLNVRLQGRQSNRDGLGARVALRANGRTQHRVISGGSNFGCTPFEQHFGLGTAAEVDGLDIRWPSGLQQRIESLPVNATIRIIEGEPGFEMVYAQQT